VTALARILLRLALLSAERRVDPTRYDHAVSRRIDRLHATMQLLEEG
jgi:hypothetical protein